MVTTSAPARPQPGDASPAARGGGRRPRSRFASQLGVLVAVVGVLALLAVALVVIVQVARPVQPNPFLAQQVYRDPDGAAVREAASGDPRAAQIGPIAAQPTATWLLPEDHPIGQVGAYARGIAQAAAAQNRIPLFVVYGIPDRDCAGGFSGGGLADAVAYRAWSGEIATALTGTGSAVVLEPDALASAAECGDVDAEVAELAAATDAFAAARTVTYLDAGHSTWRTPEEMADLLNRAGIGKVRGFASNVANYNADDVERPWAERVSALTGGSRYVIDTSRNGAGSDGVWCNPSGRRLGAAPRAVDDGSHQDADLWIKNPGTSDGTCNGGPQAGAWWWENALQLVQQKS